ncbi:MAG TPA: hypothetical protein PL155_01255 [Candidatus Omnitrophota bacterium]|nr:hypothetical protein [Candidatus Omnitrophota bacterium]HPD84886.1 hypothetical protein [Candidatus Omnitrophota bacterium]HRZ03744.1 hypothetical protein [Candidatus Omnitrophota bacterium]
MTSWDLLIIDPLRKMLTMIAGFIPVLFGVLVILIVGWIIAKTLAKLTQKLMDAIKFNSIADKAGISNVLKQGGISTTANEMVAGLVYWLVMIMVLVMAVNAIGLTVASQLLEQLTSYIPRVISALFVLVIGMFLANLIAGIVAATANNAKIPRADLLVGLTRWAIVIFTIVISLSELGIAALLVGTAFNIFFAAICLALALAFGLGGRDIAARVLHDFFKK